MDMGIFRCLNLLGCIGVLVLGMPSFGAVPQEYERLGFIRSTGEQYINTGYVPKAHDKIECVVFAPKGVAQNSYGAIFGTKSNSTMNNLWGFFVYFSNRYEARFNRNHSEFINPDGTLFPYDEKVALTCEGTSASWRSASGVTGQITISDADVVDAVAPIFLFDQGKGDEAQGAIGHKSNIRLYSFKVTDANGMVQCDYVPVRRISDGMIGLFDQARQVFAGSATATTFAAGWDDAISGETFVKTGDERLVVNGVELTGALTLEAGTLAVAEAAYQGISCGSLTLAGGSLAFAQLGIGTPTIRVAGAAQVTGNVAVKLPAALAAGTYDLVTAASFAVVSGASISLAEGAATGGDGATRTLEVTETGVRVVVGARTLPRGYRAIPSIRSDGQQWLDTGVDADEMTSVDLRFGGVSYVNQTVFFGQDAWTGHRFLFNQQSGRFYFHGRGVAMTTVAASTDYRLTVGNNEQIYLTTADAEPAVYADTRTYNGANRRLALFATNAGGYRSSFTCYGLRIARCGEIVRDFMPCRAPNGEVGLWDWVSGRFFNNKGTGAFEGGDEGAARLGYLQATGTQYIDTGYIVKALDKVECVVKTPASGYPATYSALFGTKYAGDETTASGTMNQIFGFFVRFSNRMETRYNRGKSEYMSTTQGASGEGTFPYDERTTLVCQGDTATWSSVSGTSGYITVPPEAVVDTTAPLFVFDQNSGAGVALGHKSVAAIYSLRITSSDNVVQRDFIPWRTAAGEVGFFDRVEGKFYANKGTGSFKYDVACADPDVASGDFVVYDGLMDSSTSWGGCTNVIKQRSSELNIAAATAFPALTVLEGTVSLKNDVIGAATIAGKLTLAGGTMLAVDLRPYGCDSFVAESLDLSAASTESPVTLKISARGISSLAEGQSFTVIPSGLVAGDERKFEVVGFPARIRVVDGALVLVASPVGTVAWTGTENGRNWSEDGNWQDNRYPQTGDSVVFNQAEGGVLSQDLASLVLNGLTFGTEAGAYANEGGLTLGVLHAVTNLSSSVQTFALPMALGSVGEPFTAFVAADGGLTLPEVTEMSSDVLYKKGGGVLEISDAAICAAGDVRVEDGVLQIGTRSGRTQRRYEPVQLTTSDQLVWRNTYLSNVRTVTAVADPDSASAHSYWSGLILPFHWTVAADGLSATVDFQQYDGTYTKGVSVVLTQKGDDVYARFTAMQYQKAFIVGQPFANLKSTSNYRLSHLRPVTSYEPVMMTTGWQTIWKNINLGEVTGLKGYYTGSWCNQYVDATGWFWNYNSASGTATVQVHDTGHRSTVVELKQVGPDVQARSIRTGYSPGKTPADNMEYPVNVLTVATSPTGNHYGTIYLRPLPMSDDEIVRQEGGQIVVSPGACLDVGLNHNNAATLAQTESTHGKKVFVAGDGPDGRGALYNSVLTANWGCTFGHVVLTGNASAGGGAMDVRPLAGSTLASAAGSARLEGPFTLTTDCQRFCLCDMSVDVGSIVNKQFMVLAYGLTGGVTNGIHQLANSRLQLYNVTLTKDMPLVVDAGSTNVLLDTVSAVSVVNGAFTVEAGAEAAFSLSQDLTLNDVFKLDGSVETSGAASLVMTHALEGNGTLAGAHIRFSGANSQWRMKADNTGFIEKVNADGVTDAAFLQGLRAVTIVYTGSLEEARSFDVAPAGSLSESDAVNIALTVVDAAGDAVSGCRLAVEEGRLCFHVGDFSFPRTAIWTGEGDTSVYLDPDNWICSNDRKEILPGVSPTLETWISLNTPTTFNCPAGSLGVNKTVSLSGAYTLELAADCDWSGVDLNHFVGMTTIDLKGHNLTVLMSSNPTNQLEITDSSAVGDGGTLRLLVPAGQTVTNEKVTFTGSLALEKTGAGKYINKIQNAHSGGTAIAEGTFALFNDAHNGTTYACVRFRHLGVVGATVTVATGATFDLMGNYDLHQYALVLAGGQLTSTTYKMSTIDNGGIGSLTLTADSTIDLPKTADNVANFLIFNTGNPCWADLGGHRLTIDVHPGSGNYLCLKQYGFKNGTVRVVSGGWFRVYGESIEWVNASLEEGAALWLDASVTVEDFQCFYQSAGDKKGSGGINIKGAYTPGGVLFHNFTMLNGSTFDLKGLALPWQLEPITLTAGGQFYVDLAGKTLSSEDPVISWDAANPPEGIQQMRFRVSRKPGNPRGELSVRADGVYFVSGFSIFLR
ncbi:MAG: hypothetical protein MJ249_07270 [Kiritimatiellae bacterium]|nr:hypothetical protein [Kiritimatiellia bacterium]